MDEKIEIIDGSDDKNYFTIVPNYILNHSSAIDQALYLQMKRCAGENGLCFMTQQTMAKKLDISREKLRRSLKYLLKRNWVDILQEKRGSTQRVNIYKINSIWDTNNDFYRKDKETNGVTLTSLEKTNGVTLTLGMGSPSPLEEEPIKKNQFTIAEIPLKEKVKLNELRKVVDHFFEIQGWNIKNNPVYARHTKPAKTLLQVAESPETAMLALDRCKKWADDAGFSWTIDTVIKHYNTVMSKSIKSGFWEVKDGKLTKVN